MFGSMMIPAHCIEGVEATSLESRVLSESFHESEALYMVLVPTVRTE